jgi:hypothetical protein
VSDRLHLAGMRQAVEGALQRALAAAQRQRQG